jgi:lysophospholipase L1-like esterase
MTPCTSRQAQLFWRGMAARFRAPDLALSNGASVASWASVVGGVSATQSTSASKPTYSTTGWSDGGPCVQFAGGGSSTAQHLRVDSLVSLANHSPGPKAFSVMALCRPSAVNAAACLYGCGDVSASGIQRVQCYVDDSAGLAVWCVNPSDVGHSYTTAGQPYLVRTDEDLLAFWRIDAASTELRLNGTQLAGDISWNPWTSAEAAAIGTAISSGGASNSFAGTLRELIVWDESSGAVSADKRWAGAVWLLGRKDLVRRTEMGFGDSITVGGPVTSWFTGQTRSKSYIGESGTAGVGVNLAHNGATLMFDANAVDGTYVIYDNLLTDLATMPYDPRRPSVLALLAGGNDATVGADVNTIATRYQTVIAAMRAARPYDVIVAAPEPRRTGVSNAISDGYAAAVAANAVSWGADLVWRPDRIPEAQDPTNTTYFSDGIHPTQALQNLMRDAYAQLNAGQYAADRMIARLLL